MSEQPQEIACVLLSGFGAVFLLYKLFKLACLFLRLITAAGFGGGSFPLRSYGSWAVVTGATDGIGREYAMQLASKGMNIVLVSRSPAKLADVAAAIMNLHKVETKVIVADFTRGCGLYAEIGRQLENLDIGVLVNNVGMASTVGNFLDVPSREHEHPAMIYCNALSSVGMTGLVLRGMLAKNRGVIINISSIAGEGHDVIPEGVYSATKSFLSALSRSLHVEYVSQGITVQNITPGVVSTNMVKRAKAKSKFISASAFVKSALHTLGALRDTCGCLRHQAMLEALNLLPRFVLLLMRARLLSVVKARK